MWNIKANIHIQVYKHMSTCKRMCVCLNEVCSVCVGEGRAVDLYTYKVTKILIVCLEKFQFFFLSLPPAPFFFSSCHCLSLAQL